MATTALRKDYWVTQDPIQPQNALWISFPLGTSLLLGTHTATATPAESTSGYHTMSVREVHVTKRVWYQGDITYTDYYVGTNFINSGNLPVRRFYTAVSRVTD